MITGIILLFIMFIIYCSGVYELNRNYTNTFDLPKISSILLLITFILLILNFIKIVAKL